MWQVVRDTGDGLMDANLFTDDWPDWTTVVSQEFAPKLSQVTKFIRLSYKTYVSSSLCEVIIKLQMLIMIVHNQNLCINI